MELVRLGAKFTRAPGGELALTREGGHSARRIVHAADVTGREIERALLAAATANSNIHFFEHFSAVDLITSEVCIIALCHESHTTPCDFQGRPGIPPQGQRKLLR